jgi:hypothetical protein
MIESTSLDIPSKKCEKTEEEGKKKKKITNHR